MAVTQIVNTNAVERITSMPASLVYRDPVHQNNDFTKLGLLSRALGMQINSSTMAALTGIFIWRTYA